MGRTLPTQVQMLRQEEDSWKSFRRALRKDDQAAFDDVWAYARRHSTAASMASRPLPFEAHFLSMILGLKRELDEVKELCRVSAPPRGRLTPPDGDLV